MEHQYSKDELYTIALNLRRWFKTNEYKGIDPFQLDEKLFSRNIPFLSVIRKTLKPFHVLIPNKAFSSLPKIYYPKAFGLIIAGNCLLYKKISDKQIKAEILKENNSLILLLKQTKSHDFQNFCWGWPFSWGQSPRYPANTALTCVTSPILHGLLDYYIIQDNEKKTKETIKIQKEIRIIIKSAIEFLLLDNKYYEGKDGICFYYSHIDKHKAISGNAIAAAFLLRYGTYFKNKELLDIGKKAVLFTLNHQEKDGSWKYIVDAEPTKENKVDNRHTGYILEALTIAHEILTKCKSNNLQKDIIKDAIQRGLAFYKKNLFDGYLPKWSPEKTYPIDCHDVAQAIITMQIAGEKEFAQNILQFAIEKMSNGKDEFYYKYFENGKVNNSVFFRWNQAWMYVAIASCY
ncbi:terpene cyclase/mutase family protein [Candidatus Woesearchaeota archaeon]|nr:terpene cyclase/mutase family protein [Candidatus Woesearchaeota archaeon]